MSYPQTLVQHHPVFPIPESDIFKSNDRAARMFVQKYPGATITQVKILRVNKRIYLKCNFSYAGRNQVMVFDQTPAWSRVEGTNFLSESPETVVELIVQPEKP